MISVKGFTKQNVEEVLTVATRMKELVAKKGGCDVLNVFFILGVLTFSTASWRTSSLSPLLALLPLSTLLFADWGAK